MDFCLGVNKVLVLVLVLVLINVKGFDMYLGQRNTLGVPQHPTCCSYLTPCIKKRSANIRSGEIKCPDV